VKCPHCSRDFEPVEGQRFCPLCGQGLDATTGESSEQPEPEGFRQEHRPEPFEAERIEYCPWEDQENLGFSQALVQSLKQSMFAPTAFFEKMPLHSGFLLPVLFAMIIGTIGSMAAYLWSMAVGSTVLSELAGSNRNAAFLAVLIPLFVFLGIFIWGVILHVSLFLVGGAKEDFEATFRVVCYTSGPELLGVIPVIGGLASLVWKVYMTVAGLRAVHGISNGRAVAALVLPGLLCCAIGVVAFVSVSFLLSSH
jgi:hypothetical protein